MMFAEKLFRERHTDKTKGKMYVSFLSISIQDM